MREKLLLILVGILAVAALVRVFSGPPSPEGLVVWTDLKPCALESAIVEFDEPTAVVVDATGSVGEHAGAFGLAATAWVLNATDRTVAWDMQHAELEEGRGALRHVRASTFTLGPGRYEVYFASFGRRHRRCRRGDLQGADDWRFVLRTANENAEARQVFHVLSPRGPSVVWDATMLGDEEKEEYLFEVSRAVTITVAATGQISGLSQEDRGSSEGARDHSWIENAEGGIMVWSMAAAQVEPAGGAPFNWKFSGDIVLQPGVYRAVARTNRSHAYGAWLANPPFDPGAWGLRITSTDREAIAHFDPWTTREPVASFLRQGDDVRVEWSFEVRRRVPVVLYSLGEIVTSGKGYDYGQLFRERPREYTSPEVLIGTWIKLRNGTWGVRVGRSVEKGVYSCQVTSKAGETSIQDIRVFYSGDDYALAELGREREDSRDLVWRLAHDNSRHAGGASKNRYGLAIRVLDPGIYTLEYRSDGSHAWNTWNDEEPEFPYRWGVALFPLERSLPHGVIVPRVGG